MILLTNILNLVYKKFVVHISKESMKSVIRFYFFLLERGRESAFSVELVVKMMLV